MSLYDTPLLLIDGSSTDLSAWADDALLIVNVASKCGFTGQYAGLEALHRAYADRGLHVLGFPCDQFGGQEPGTEAEIAAFCSATYGVSFPMFGKVDVRGPGRDPLWAELTGATDAAGEAGEVQWNFEKFLVGPAGAVVARFRTPVAPDDPALVAAVEAVLPGPR